MANGFVFWFPCFLDNGCQIMVIRQQHVMCGQLNLPLHIHFHVLTVGSDAEAKVRSSV
jgi:hypothetical protein